MARKRFELRAIKLEMSKMRAVEKSRLSKLSSTFGSLILNKVALEVELNDLLGSLKSQHPEVKKKSLELAVSTRCWNMVNWQIITWRIQPVQICTAGSAGQLRLGPLMRKLWR